MIAAHHGFQVIKSGEIKLTKLVKLSLFSFSQVKKTGQGELFLVTFAYVAKLEPFLYCS